MEIGKTDSEGEKRAVGNMMHWEDREDGFGTIRARQAQECDMKQFYL
jgi:hypothetical protein